MDGHHFSHFKKNMGIVKHLRGKRNSKNGCGRYSVSVLTSQFLQELEMSATANSLHLPVFKIFDTSLCKLNSIKPSSLHRLFIKSSVFPGGFVSRNMTELVKTPAFRNRRSSSNVDIEEDVEVIELEALVDGSTKFIASGLESTINRLTKWLISGLFGVIIIWRHDSEALWAVMGTVINSILSIVLKHILNQERPVPTLKSDPGMPSSHAQSIFFIAGFVILSIVEWLGIKEASLTISGLTLALSSYLSWLRVSQKLHTISQVVVGAAVGSTFSILWFSSWKAFVLEAFNSNLSVQIAVALGAAVFGVGFGLYGIKHWLTDE